MPAREAAFDALHCPFCKDAQLEMRRVSGVEILRQKLTGKRKFKCMRCSHSFRAPDPREEHRSG